MATEVDLRLLGRLVEQLPDGQREIKAELGEIKAQMATREQLTRLWRVAEGKLELGRAELVDADAALVARLDALEARVRRLEAASLGVT
jgi:hypothetical protein